jgi:hypothetical protein
MIEPSYWKETKLNPETNKPETKEGYYKFINPPEKNNIRDLKPVEDIESKLLEVFTKHGFTYDKEAHQKHLRNEKSSKNIIQPVKIATAKTPEITHELIENTKKCYYTGCMDEFGFRLSDMLVRDGWNEKQLRKLFEALPYDDIDKCYSWIKQSVNKPKNKLTGWKGFRKAIYTHCNPPEDAPVVEKFYMDFIDYGKILNLVSMRRLDKEKEIFYCQALINDLKNNKDSQPFNNLILKHLENIKNRYSLISRGTPYSTRINEFYVIPITKHTYYDLGTLKLCSIDELTGEIIYNENKDGTTSKTLMEYKKIPTFEIVKEEYEELNNLDTTNYIRFNNGILNTKMGTFEKELFSDLKIKMKTVEVEYKENNESLEKLWNIFSKNFKEIDEFKLMLADITHLRIDDVGWSIISTFGTGKDFTLNFLKQLTPIADIPGTTFNEDNPRFSKKIINKNTFLINEANTLSKTDMLISLISGTEYGFNIKYGDYYEAKNTKLILLGNSLKPSISNNNQLSEKLVHVQMNQHNFRNDKDKLDRNQDWSNEIGAFYYWLFNTADTTQMKNDILDLAKNTRDKGTRPLNIDDLLGEYFEIDNSAKFVDGDEEKYDYILYDDFRNDVNKIIKKHNIGEKFEDNKSGQTKIGYLLNRFFYEVLSNRKGFIYTDNKYGKDGIKEIRYKQRKSIEGEQKNVLVGIKKIKEIE